MANDKECSEERQCLNKTEFEELIPHLSVDDLKLVEYFIGKWCFLIKYTKDSKFSYTCNLCSVSVISTSNLIDHLGGGMHSKKMKTVKELYHPDYTYYKKIDSTNSEAQKPVQKIFIIPTARLMENSGKRSCEKTSESNHTKEKRDRSPKRSDGTKKAKLVLNPIASTKPVQIRFPSFSSNITCNNNVSVSNTIEEPTFTKKSVNDVNTDKTQALIGVEYVIKICKGAGDMSPMFECTLCDITSNELVMQSHLVGYKHRLQYCTKHFPTAIRHYKKFIDGLPENSSHRIMLPILEKLSFEIYQHHGRELPYEVSYSEYESNRDSVHSKVYSFRHASERLGPSFINVLSTSEIKQLKARVMCATMKQVSSEKTVTQELVMQNMTPQYTSNIQTIPHAVGPSVNVQSNFHCSPIAFQDLNPVDDSTHKAMVEKFLRQTSGGLHKQSENQSQFSSKTSDKKQHSSRYEPYHNDQRRPSPVALPRQEGTFDSFINKKMRDLNKRYAFYRKNPEQHPLYNIEWQDFWKKCKSKLISEGVDYVNYDYQPKWINFFEDRIEELYHEEKSSIRLQAHQMFPMSNPEKTIFIETNMHKRAVFERPIPADNQLIEEPIICDTTFSVVSVLRFLTALEEQLGSLGPKIVELLSKALQVEKINPTKINSIILTNENCTILETAMEKFKGLLVAGLLDSPKERALKKAIIDVGKVLKLAEKERKENDDLLSIKESNFVVKKPSNDITIRKEQATCEQTQTKEPTVSCVAKKTPILENIDKTHAVISLQDVLRSKGHTDIDANHLQQLVSVYSLMEKKKKEAEAKLLTRVQDQQKTLSDTLQSMLGSSSTSISYSNQSSIFNNDPRIAREKSHSTLRNLNNSYTQNSANYIASTSGDNNSMSSNSVRTSQSLGYNVQQRSNYMNNNSLLQSNNKNNMMSNNFMNNNNNNNTLNNNSLLQSNNKNNMMSSNFMNNNNNTLNNNDSNGFLNNQRYFSYNYNNSNSNAPQKNSNNNYNNRNKRQYNSNNSNKNNHQKY